MAFGITEFTYLDPEELHLVLEGANGFSPVLAKARATVDEIIDEAEKELYSEDGFVKYVSAEARQSMAGSGEALPNGDFPIADEGHLRSAIGRLGNYNGNKAAAKKHIIKRARALGKVDMLPKDWSVEKDAQAAAEAQVEGASIAPSEVQTADAQKPSGAVAIADPMSDMPEGDPSVAAPMLAADGSGSNVVARLGDTAPDKSVPLDEARSQTAEVSRVVGALKDAFKLAEENKADDKTLKAINRATDFLSSLVVAGTNQVASKETDNMTQDELLKLLDDRDAAKEAAKQAKKEAKKAKEAEAKKAEVEEAKIDVTKAEESVEVAKSESDKTDIIANAVKAALEPLLARIDELEKQPAGHPMLNASGVAGAKPVVRGQETEGGMFKGLEERLEKATTVAERQNIRTELLTAKMSASERSRVSDPRMPVSILRQPETAYVNAAIDGSK